MIRRKDILDAWAFLRRHNHSLPDEVLDFIKESSLKALEHPHPVQSEVMQIFTKPELDQRIEQACREQRDRYITKINSLAEVIRAVHDQVYDNSYIDSLVEMSMLDTELFITNTSEGES